MTTRVGRVPPRLIEGANAIQAKRLVRGATQWQAMAQAGTWLLGKGSSLVVGGPPGAGAIAPGDSVTLSYFLWPHERSLARLWCISLMSGTSDWIKDVSAGLTGTFEIPSGADAVAWTIPEGSRTYEPLSFRFVQVLDTPDGTAGSIDIVIGNDSSSGNDLHIAGVCCYEIPRGVIASGLVDPATCESGQTIYAAGDSQSIHAAALSAHEARDDARRAKLFDFCNVAGVHISDGLSSGASNVLAADPYVMCRHLYRDAAGDLVITGTVAVAVKAGVFETGQVYIEAVADGGTPTLLDGVTLTFDSPTPTWKTGVIEFEMLSVVTEDVENLGTNAGIRGAVRQHLVVEAITTGAGSIIVYGIAVGESG